MKQWWALLAAAALVVGCGSSNGNGDDDDNIPVDPVVNPGSCVLDSGYDGAALPDNFPMSPMGVEVGQTINDFNSCLANSTGVDYHLYAFLGKVVMINMGAGWCPPCKDEADDIQLLYDSYHEQGLVVLMGMIEGYTGGSSPSGLFLDNWSNNYGLTFPVLADPSASMGQYYRNGEQGYIPLNLVIDRDGVVVYNSVGGISFGTANSVISNAINKPSQLNGIN